MKEFPSELVERKFIETLNVSDWEVETSSGWVDIEKSNKTIEYDVWRLELSNGMWLECADNHIVFTPYAIDGLDYEMSEVFVKDLKIGDYIVINGEYSFGKVSSVIKLDRKENMYDLTVGGNHTYYTNDILSHNTLILGNTTINAIKTGKNVLYISFEISQDELGRRMDSAFTGLPIANITKMRNEVRRRITDEYATNVPGRLIIKEFPPSSINANEVEGFVHRLRLKKDFIPDIVVLDYLGIMKPISNTVTNSYEKGKCVSEELRALSSRLNCPILTATQYNRCLGLDSIVDHKELGKIKISEIKTGDYILGDGEYVKVSEVFPIEKQKCYKIKTKSGKEIICSGRHIFPTENGQKSIFSGLGIGDMLVVK